MEAYLDEINCSIVGVKTYLKLILEELKMHNYHMECLVTTIEKIEKNKNGLKH